MVKDFHVGHKDSASLYAGIFISAFAFAESMTGFFWGGLSDRIGRKPVLLIGCTGTMISLIVVGLSTNFWIALAGRALGGLLSKCYDADSSCTRACADMDQMATLASSRQW